MRTANSLRLAVFVMTYNETDEWIRVEFDQLKKNLSRNDTVRVIKMFNRWMKTGEIKDSYIKLENGRFWTVQWSF